MAEQTFRARDHEGEFEFTLPEGGRVTFGPDLPFSKGKERHAYGGATTYALRLYGGKGNDTLLACFPHVEWFRPKGLTVTRILDGEDGMILDIPAGPRRPYEGEQREAGETGDWFATTTPVPGGGLGGALGLAGTARLDNMTRVAVATPPRGVR